MPFVVTARMPRTFACPLHSFRAPHFGLTPAANRRGGLRRIAYRSLLTRDRDLPTHVHKRRGLRCDVFGRVRPAFFTPWRRPRSNAAHRHTPCSKMRVWRTRLELRYGQMGILTTKRRCLVLATHECSRRSAHEHGVLRVAVGLRRQRDLSRLSAPGADYRTLPHGGQTLSMARRRRTKSPAYGRAFCWFVAPCCRQPCKSYRLTVVDERNYSGSCRIRPGAMLWKSCLLNNLRQDVDAAPAGTSVASIITVSASPPLTRPPAGFFFGAPETRARSASLCARAWSPRVHPNRESHHNRQRETPRRKANRTVEKIARRRMQHREIPGFFSGFR